MFFPRCEKIISVMAELSLKDKVGIESSEDSSLFVLSICILIFFAVFFLIALIIKIKDFLQQYKYINIEIQRNSGAERRYWILRKRQLWNSFFFGDL